MGRQRAALSPTLAVFYGGVPVHHHPGGGEPASAGRSRIRRPGKPGLRLRTLADVFAYAAAEGVKLRMDGTEVQVRRPAANRPGRRAFVSGKKKQNTLKSTAISDGHGQLQRLGHSGPAASTT